MQMEVNAKEKMLILAVRAMDEVPANVLLWYAVGLKTSRDNAATIWGEDSLRLQSDDRKLEVANKYQKHMGQVTL